MGSGRGDRNQGSRLRRPLSCDDTGPCERWLTSPLPNVATDPASGRAPPLTWARVLPRTPLTSAPLAPITRSAARRLIHKSNLMTVTTPSPSDVSVTL